MIRRDGTNGENRMLHWKTPFLLAALLIVADTAAAQPRPWGEAIIYRDRNYAGPRVRLNRERTNLRLRWSVGSVRLVHGRMEICSERDFRGTCATLTRSFSNIVSLGLPGNRVQSARPVARPVPARQ
jgi:hypothetical protein